MSYRQKLDISQRDREKLWKTRFDESRFLGNIFFTFTYRSQLKAGMTWRKTWCTHHGGASTGFLLKFRSFFMNGMLAAALAIFL